MAIQSSKRKIHYVKKKLEIGDYILFNGEVGKVKEFPEEEDEVICRFIANPLLKIKLLCEALTYISEAEAKEVIYQNLKNL